ncbi:MAG: YdeI/OmpD-associated family protein [Sediminibacterium sp.]|nr:YdeI/OmpD-associated family protein [Sediminibacterium sp.]
MKPLLDKTVLLEKFQGKGGWTFARIPEIAKNKDRKFGWVKVRGTIDGYEIRKYHLMPMGNGQLFLPVKAEIRKAIKKMEGDSVRIILYPDNEPLDVPEEFRMCLQEDVVAQAFFNSLSESEQKFYIQWIYSSKKEETRIKRMAESINRLAKRQKLYAKDLSKNQ